MVKRPGFEATTNLHIAPRLNKIKPYLSHPICLHGARTHTHTHTHKFSCAAERGLGYTNTHPAALVLFVFNVRATVNYECSRMENSAVVAYFIVLTRLLPGLLTTLSVLGSRGVRGRSGRGVGGISVVAQRKPVQMLKKENYLKGKVQGA